MSVSNEDERRSQLLKLLEWKKELLDEEKNVPQVVIREMTAFLEKVNLSIEGVLQRTTIIVLEEILSRCWQESDFSKGDTEQSVKELAEATIKKLLLLQQLNGQGRLWFGGLAPALSSSRNNDSPSSVHPMHTRLIAIALIAMNIAATEESTVMSVLSRLVLSSGSSGLITHVTENDDRCLTVLLALLRNRDKIPKYTMFEPKTLTIGVFQSISFDHHVMLDWLMSEPSAVPFFFELFRSLGEDKEEWMTTAEQWATIRHLPSEWLEEPAEAESGEEPMAIEVKELAGEMLVNKKFEFPKHEPTRRFHPSRELTVEGGMWTELETMLVRFRSMLEKHQKSGTATINCEPLIRLCVKFEQA